MELTGMVAEAVDPIERIPDGFCMELAGDGHGILDVNAAAYGLSMDAARDAFCPSSFWSGHFPVLGRLDDGPVASAAVLMVGGVRYVALVATVPRYQRRGFAEAVMRHALALAAEAHGHTLSVLHATHAGRPVYERMGYRPISTHTIFIDKKFLGEH
jgi:ribosomal protein S18 acetylase RimI-like enzyme